MGTIALDLNKHMLITSSGESSESELVADAIANDGSTSTSEISSFDLSFLMLIGDKLASKRDYEITAIDTMLEFSGYCKEMIFETNKHLIAARTALDESLPRSDPIAESVRLAVHGSVISSLTNGLSSAKGSLTSAKDSLGAFANAINPKNGLSAIAALAKFLMCPEESFLADLFKAFNVLKDLASNFDIKALLKEMANNIVDPIRGMLNDVVDGVKNKIIDFKDMLKDALSNLTQHLLNRFPLVNNMLIFFNLLNSFFNSAGGDKQYALDSILDLLGKHGLDLDYFDNFNVLDNIKDLLNPENPIYENLDIPNTLPREEVINRCSALGKIIAQLEGSYRTGNRFDDLITDKSILAHIDDPELLTVVDNLLGVSNTSGLYYDASLANAANGYHGKTATNAALSAAIENGVYLEVMLASIEEAESDPVMAEVAAINISAQTRYLQDLNNVTAQRLLAFDEGLENIKQDIEFNSIGKEITGALTDA